MKCVVTGAAGFIGSHLCEHLLAQGHEVHGIDAFIPYYSPEIKQRNLGRPTASSAFHFHRLDLRVDSAAEAIRGADAVYHLAAMPGLTRSWHDFDLYESCNVTATHRLLEALRLSDRPARLIHASTSSVYGRNARGNEDEATHPISPYGITKLAAENLVRAYAATYGIPTVVLRYFSVYGPRQRPDMGYHQFIRAWLKDEPITVYGDGNQVRGNTYVSDCVEATVLAAAAPSGTIFNVGGGEPASVWDILRHLEQLAGRPPKVLREPARAGDQGYTLADTTKIRHALDWRPRVSLKDGLAQQWAWQTSQETVGSGPHV